VADLVSERSPINQFRDNVGGTTVERGIEHSDDIRVIQRARGAGFGHESVSASRVAVGALVQYLESHLAFEPRIPRAIDRAAPTLTEESENCVRSERRIRNG